MLKVYYEYPKEAVLNKVLVINNHNAGRKQSIKYKKRILDFLLKNSSGFKFITPDELERVNVDEFDTLIAVGGDGTVNKLLPYLVNTDKKLGIIPTGTANLLAAKLGIPENLNKSLEIIENEKIVKTDCLKINDKFSILRTGFGYDGDIICKTSQSLKNKFGYFSYFVAGILFTLRLTSKKYNLKIDNKKLTENATCLIVANAANMYKNIFTVGKKARIDDGIFDIFIMKTKNPVVFFFEFLKILLNLKYDNKNVKYIKAQSVALENNYAICHIDGEKQKIREDIKIDILPKSVNVICNYHL